MALGLIDTLQHEMNGKLGRAPIQSRSQSIFLDEVN